MWIRAGVDKWIPDKGASFSGTVEARDNDDYRTTDAIGLTRALKPDGSKLLADIPVATIKNLLRNSATGEAYYEQSIGSMDLNHDGGLDRAELNAVLSSRQSNGPDKLLAASLMAAYKPISDLHNDPDSLPGISAGDVDGFDELNRFEEPSKYGHFHPGLGPRIGRWKFGAGSVTVGGTVAFASFINGIPGLTKGPTSAY